MIGNTPAEAVGASSTRVRGGGTLPEAVLRTGERDDRVAAGAVGMGRCKASRNTPSPRLVPVGDALPVAEARGGVDVAADGEGDGVGFGSIASDADEPELPAEPEPPVEPGPATVGCAG